MKDEEDRSKSCWRKLKMCLTFYGFSTKCGIL